MVNRATKGIFAGLVAFGAASYFLGLSAHVDGASVFGAALAIGLGAGALVAAGGIGKP